MLKAVEKNNTQNDFGNSFQALQLIYRHGPTDQQSVAKKLGITLPATFSHFKKLKKEGLLSKTNLKRNNGKGRPSTLWEISKSTNFTSGFVIVPPYLLCGTADFDNNICLEDQVDLTDVNNQDGLFDVIDSFFDKSLGRIDEKNGDLRFVSFGLPGYLDKNNSVIKSVNMPVLEGMKIRDHFLEKYGIQCKCHSHYYTYYYAEKTYMPPNTTLSVIDWELGLGHVAGCNDDFFSVATDSKKSPRGIHDIAHMRIVPEGAECICGNKGCLEAYTGGWAIIRQLNDPKIKTLDDIIRSALNNDSKTLEVLSKAAFVLGREMTWVVQFLGIEKIVFTGPLSRVFNLVKEDFCRGLAERMTEEEISSLDPHTSPDPLRRMIKGACYMSRHIFLNPNSDFYNLCVISNTEGDYKFNYS